jgi:hypothetical protein
MLADIRAAVSAVMPIQADAERLRGASLIFLDGKFAAIALLAGWNAVEMFGVHCGPKARERQDVLGLVPAIAFSVFDLSIVAINGEHATVLSRAGSLLRHPRRRANHDQSIPWWQHATISRDA